MLKSKLTIENIKRLLLHSLTLTTANVLVFAVAISCVVLNTNTVVIRDGENLITRVTMERSPDQILVDENIAVGQLDRKSVV